MTLLELSVHHLDGDHRVVDQEAERNDERAERDAVQIDAGQRHDEDRDRQHQRDREGDDDSGPQAQRDQRDDEHDGDRLAERLQKLMDRLGDDFRLVGDLAELDADRQVALDALERALDGGADFGDIGARRHCGAEQYRLAALVAGLGGRRIFEAALDLRDVAEAKGLRAGAKPQLANVLDRLEPALDVDADRALARLDPPGGVDRILAAERRLDVEHGQTALCQRRGGNLDEDALILGPQEIDLGDAGDAQQCVARVLRETLELRVGEALTRHGIERDIGIAELVVEKGTDHALRQRLANVADLLAHLVEGVLHRIAANRALQVDEDVGEARPRVGADEVETRRLLQLALDLVDHLVLHFLHGCARPHHLHDHHAEGEIRILLLADTREGDDAGREQQHQEKRGEAAVADRPFRQVEARRGAARRIGQ